MGNRPSSSSSTAKYGRVSSEKPFNTGGIVRKPAWSLSVTGGCRDDHAAAARYRKDIDKLVADEKQFLSSMQTLVDVFYSPLVRWLEQQQQHDGARAETRSDVDILFSNIDELIIFSRGLLQALKRKHAARSNAMSVVLLQLATSFKTFQAFLAGYKEASACLSRMEASPSVAMFLRACELQERCEGLRLRDFITIPLLHVTKYRLFVESASEGCPSHLEVLQRELAQRFSSSPKVDDEIHLLVQNGQHHSRKRGYATKVVARRDDQVEETGKLLVSFGSMPGRPSQRERVKEGILTKIDCKGPRAFRFVLSPDALSHEELLVENMPLATGQQEHRSLDRIKAVPLNHCFVVEGFAPPLHASFVVAAMSGSFLVQARDLTEKNKWVTALKTAMDRHPMSKSGSTTSSGLHTSGHPAGYQTCSINDAGSRSVADIIYPQQKMRAAKKDDDDSARRGGKHTGRHHHDITTHARAFRSSSFSSSVVAVAAHSCDEPITMKTADPGGFVTNNTANLSRQPSPILRHCSRSLTKRVVGRKKGGRRKKGTPKQLRPTAVRLVSTKTSTKATGRGCPISGRASTGSTGLLQCGGVPRDPREEEASEESCCALEQCSLWIACGVENKVLRLETLRRDGPFPGEKWSDSVGFRRMLADPACFAEFRETLRVRHAVENLDFWEAVCRYQVSCCPKSAMFLGSRTDEDLAAADVARDIIDRFVKQGAPQQVNLSADSREAILSRQAVDAQQAGYPQSVDLFTIGWVEVSNLLQRDLFVQFRRSEAYLRLEREWSQESARVIPASEFVVLDSDGFTRASDSLAMLALRSWSAPTSTPPGIGGASSVRSSLTTEGVMNGASKSISTFSSLMSGLTSSCPRSLQSVLPERAVGGGGDAGASSTALTIHITAPVALVHFADESVIREGPPRMRLIRSPTIARQARTTAKEVDLGMSGDLSNGPVAFADAGGSGGITRATALAFKAPKHLPNAVLEHCLMPQFPSLRSEKIGTKAKRKPPGRCMTRTDFVSHVSNQGSGGSVALRNVTHEDVLSSSWDIPPVPSVVKGVQHPLGAGEATTENALSAESLAVSPPFPPPRLTYRRGHPFTRTASTTSTIPSLAPSASRCCCRCGSTLK